MAQDLLDGYERCVWKSLWMRSRTEMYCIIFISLMVVTRINFHNSYVNMVDPRGIVRTWEHKNGESSFPVLCRNLLFPTLFFFLTVLFVFVLFSPRKNKKINSLLIWLVFNKLISGSRISLQELREFIISCPFLQKLGVLT